MRPALSAAALLSVTLILISSCSSGQIGIAAPASSISHTSVPPTPLTSTTSTAAPTSSPPETLILGTNLLGAHQFNLGTGYNAKQIAQGVEVILTKPVSTGYGYPSSAITNIKCPTSQPVTAGTSFECTVDINGEPKTVSVDIISNHGLFIVQAPH